MTKEKKKEILKDFYECSVKKDNKSETYKLLQEKLPDMSMETMKEVLGIIESVSNKENRKKKKEIDPVEKEAALKKDALQFITSNYMKFILLQEGKGYYVIAHSMKIKVVLEHHRSVFQPHEKTEEKDFCCITVVQYNSMDKKDIEAFMDIGCSIVYIK